MAATAHRHTEYELKFRLTAAEYQRLFTLFKTLESARVQRLSTTYFDTCSGHLRKHAAALRIRSDGAKHCLELKTARESKTSLRKHVELSVRLTKKTAGRLRRSGRSLLTLDNEITQRVSKIVAGHEVEKIATLRTTRTHVRLGVLCLDLDCVSFGPDKHYELEIETREQASAKTWVESVFGMMRIGIRHHKASKAELAWKLRKRRIKQS